MIVTCRSDFLLLTNQYPAYAHFLNGFNFIGYIFHRLGFTNLLRDLLRDPLECGFITKSVESFIFTQEL